MRVPFVRNAPSPAGTSLEDPAPRLSLPAFCVFREPLGDESDEGLAMPVVVSLLKLGLFPLPLGSFPELFKPAALAGPGGTPLTPVGPAPAEPARGEPAALVGPADELAAPPVEPPLLPPPPPPPCAKATDEVKVRVSASAAALFILISQEVFILICQEMRRCARETKSNQAVASSANSALILTSRDGVRGSIRAVRAGSSSAKFYSSAKA